jgi:hypothetical protein
MGASIAAPSFTLKYRAERRELWNWYKRAFWSPRGLWGYWLVVALVSSIVVMGIQTMGYPIGASGWFIAATLLIVLLGFFVIYPQAAYKARERTLTASEKGIETTIGDIFARRAWQDIASITDLGDTIAIVVAGGTKIGPAWIRTVNGNAFVIPDRAFANPVQRADFLEHIAAWHKAQALSFPRFSMARYYADIDAPADAAV